MNQYLDVNPEVAQAVAQGKPVVALESTIISHGMPYPQNVETALQVERIIRENGAVPATIAVLGGRLKAGLTKEEIEYLGKQGQAVTKASRRDLSVLVAQGADGATTVTTTKSSPRDNLPTDIPTELPTELPPDVQDRVDQGGAELEGLINDLFEQFDSGMEELDTGGAGNA